MDGIIIWGEVLFFIDFSMDFCALYFTFKLLGWKTDIKKLILASVICAVLGLICITQITGTASILILFIGWMISTILAIPSEKRRIRNIIGAVILFVILEALTGGIMTAIFYKLNQWNHSLGIHLDSGESKLRIFFIAAGIIFFMLTASMRILSNAKFLKGVTQNGTVSIRWNGYETNTHCMFDSGNLVREPISGKHVMILPAGEISALGIEYDRLSSGSLYGSRLIPVKTLDKTSVLWGILPDEINIQTENRTYSSTELYVVFSPGTDIAIVPTCILE